MDINPIGRTWYVKDDDPRWECAAQVWAKTPGGEICVANNLRPEIAALIVKCVNMHDELVSRLDRLSTQAANRLLGRSK